MPGDEKDRLGDKLREIEKGREDHYFAERERELIQKLKDQAAKTVKELARMHCPNCGERLQTSHYLDVNVDECPSCHGIWLENGELQQIAERESSGWLARFLGRSR